MNGVSSMEQVFCGHVFHVPDYQRGYTWQEKNWEDLLQDLDLLPEGRNHFTGTLVLRKTELQVKYVTPDGRENISDEYDIIDGQQRLTTVVMLLNAIHREMARLGMLNQVEEIETKYLMLKDLAGQPFSRLRLNRDCQEFFFANILSHHPSVRGPEIRSHILLQGAQVHFIHNLEKQCVERQTEYPAWLKQFYTKITQHLSVLVYEVDNDSDAGVIFETMNDRGLPLSELEKVKNYLLFLATKLNIQGTHDLSERVNNTWAEIFETLMSAGVYENAHEEQLLRVHSLMTYDADPKKWEQSRSIKNRFSLQAYRDRHEALLQDVKEYLNGLREATHAYSDIYNPKRTGAFGNISAQQRLPIIKQSEKLARIGVRVNFLPLLIAVRMKSNDDGATYLNTLTLCEKIEFRIYQWMHFRSSAAQTKLFRLGYDYYHKPNADWLLAELARIGLEYCSDGAFHERFTKKTENWYEWHGLKYFLYEYEHHLAERERKPVLYKWEDIKGEDLKRDTIEHILPQDYEENDYWIERFTRKRYERWVNDIGNLTLTYDNSSLGTKAFPKKKGRLGTLNCYANSTLFIEKDLAKYREWTVTQIQARRDEIREWALERWMIDAPPELLEPLDPNETSEERLLRLAEENECLEEFQALLSTARSLPVYTRLQRNWNAFTLAPIESKTTTLIYIRPDLYVWIAFDSIKNYLGINPSQIEEIFGKEEEIWLGPDDVGEFINNLRHLFEVAHVGKEK